MKKGIYLKALALLLDEILVAGLIVFVLWRIGVTIPLWALIPGVAFLVAVYWISYRLISAQDKHRCSSQGDMVGLKGKVVKPLNPEGFVRVRGELWQAVSQDGDVTVGTEVVVLGLAGLRVLVSPQSVLTPGADAEADEAPG